MIRRRTSFLLRRAKQRLGQEVLRQRGLVLHECKGTLDLRVADRPFWEFETEVQWEVLVAANSQPPPPTYVQARPR